MIDRSFAVRDPYGFAVSQNDMALVMCEKKKGVTFCVVSGAGRVPVRQVHPHEVSVIKEGHGEMNRWIGGFKGVWRVYIRECNGNYVSFLMKNRGEALHFKKWMEKHVSTCVPTD
ncbi:MAG: hypothetical protein IKL97_00520 [Eggerthellaceae bacterium]|nr:hypothetical protein [Eggerthellaceae bacterium]